MWFSRSELIQSQTGVDRSWYKSSYTGNLISLSLLYVVWLPKVGDHGCPQVSIMRSSVQALYFRSFFYSCSPYPILLTKYTGSLHVWLATFLYLSCSYPVSVQFSQPTFFTICPRKFNWCLEILSMWRFFSNLLKFLRAHMFISWSSGYPFVELNFFCLTWLLILCFMGKWIPNNLFK